MIFGRAEENRKFLPCGGQRQRPSRKAGRLHRASNPVCLRVTRDIVPAITNRTSAWGDRERPGTCLMRILRGAISLPGLALR